MDEVGINEYIIRYLIIILRRSGGPCRLGTAFRAHARARYRNGLASSSHWKRLGGFRDSCGRIRWEATSQADGCELWMMGH